MRSLSAYICAATLSLALITLLLTLPSCGGKVLSEGTVDGLTYTLYGNDRAERVEVSRDGKQLGTYRQRGLPLNMVGDGYGLLLTDINFDGETDFILQTAAKKTGAQYACYLWDAAQDHHVYNTAASALQGLTVDMSLRVLTAREYDYTVDPATGDTPEFYTEKNAFVIYRWVNGTLTEVHRKELTYYEESDIYCYAIFDLADDGEWDTTRESWITADRFDAAKCPLDATGYSAD